MSVELHVSHGLGCGARRRGGGRGAGARGGVPRPNGAPAVGDGGRRRRRASPQTEADARRGLRPHPRDDRRGSRGVPRLRVVAVAWEQDGIEGALERARRGGLRRVGDDLPRRERPPARIDAVRALAPLSSRRRPAGGAGVGRRRSRDVCVSRARRREWIEKSLLLAAIGESRDRGAKAIEAFAYRYPEGESVEERFLVHRTVFPRDFLDEFGFTTRARPGARRAVPARARRPRPGRGGAAGEGPARRAGGLHAEPGAGPGPAPLRRVRRRGPRRPRAAARRSGSR